MFHKADGPVRFVSFPHFFAQTLPLLRTLALSFLECLLRSVVWPCSICHFYQVICPFYLLILLPLPDRGFWRNAVRASAGLTWKPSILLNGQNHDNIIFQIGECEPSQAG